MKSRLTCLIAFVLTCQLAGAESVRFVVVSDTQGWDIQGVNAEALTDVVQHTLTLNPPINFVVVTGDLVCGTRDDAVMANQFRNWREITQPWYDADLYGLKVYPLPGNHDQSNRGSYMTLWQAAFPELPDNGPSQQKKMTYSVDIGPCHLAMVNTSAPDVLQAHTVNIRWLQEDLANSDKPIKFVFGHEPAYKTALRVVDSLDAKPSLRDQFWQILVDNGVKAYFCGHQHVADHWMKDNVHQIIVGGGHVIPDFHYLIVDADENDVTVSDYLAGDHTLVSQYKLSDTANVPSEDRTVNDYDTNWPYNASQCTWASTFFMVLLYFTATSLYNTKH